MPIKSQFVTEDILRDTPLPTHGGNYGVIPHGFIIDETRKELAIQGIEIKTELYKTSADGQIAQGIYHLAMASDPDMGLMFAWSNSYNKTMRFKCAVGAHVFICMNGVVAGDLSNYSRIHKGTSALQDAANSIKYQLADAFKHYNQLILDKEMLKSVYLSRKQQSAILGELFADKEIINISQMGIIKKEMDAPTHIYSGNPNSAWDFYNHVTLALKDSHPRSYLKDHQDVHRYFVNAFGQLLQYPLTTQEAVDEEDETDVREDLIISPAAEVSGSDFDIDVTNNPYLVNFL